MPIRQKLLVMKLMLVTVLLKRLTFMGVRLHIIAQRRNGTIPLPKNIWLREASCHDLPSVREEEIYLPNSTLVGDKAFLDPIFEAMLNEQQTTLYTPIKKPNGEELSEEELIKLIFKEQVKFVPLMLYSFIASVNLLLLSFF